ncbi:NADH dehydrogenase [ubiquinone] 1 alpha subcomplex subunit 6-like [Mya arenaria]|uniref:NADH dehydrogenase [ubiquinone] 1 alpha subcomplex subunit 6-like n=1 Tax=Mya arenaria TaxID=6604 RepID=UPI0022E62C24|nr:NADH dehydrogenase [ubiquinone] 1 alpha subcomplex subunit 6-like [Mya arenaria]
MSATKAVQGLKHAKPLLSVDRTEAKRRVINLYKSWYRQVPSICNDYHIEKQPKELRTALRHQFEKNRHVNDIRVIDMLIIKGQLDLQETKEIWRGSGQVLDYLRESIDPKPSDFMGKFYDGQQP